MTDWNWLAIFMWVFIAIFALGTLGVHERRIVAPEGGALVFTVMMRMVLIVGLVKVALNV